MCKTKKYNNTIYGEEKIIEVINTFVFLQKSELFDIIKVSQKLSIKSISESAFFSHS